MDGDRANPQASNDFRSGWCRDPGWYASRNRGGMSHRYVETLLGRLATDAATRRRFADDREALLAELQSAGFELTAIELEALASTEPGAIDRFAQSLDQRLRKAEVAPPSTPSLRRKS